MLYCVREVVLTDNKLNRIHGALCGVACGDALGATLEFVPREQVLREYPNGLRDMVGGGWLNLAPGETTDDTAMTCAVGLGLSDSAARSAVTRIGVLFIQWLRSSPPDVGATCAEAILRAERLISDGEAPERAWPEAALQVQRDHGLPSEGNGALMRTVYPGLYLPSPEQAADAAQKIAGMTHAGPDNLAACAWYSRTIWRLVETGEACWPACLQDLPPAFHGALPLEACASPRGDVRSTLNAALAALAHTSSAEEAIIAAVNLGGDADTVGAVAGGLAGARYGYATLPRRWLSRLEPSLCKVLDDLTWAASQNRK
jgi:ADP-ribosyl-[dinitrogen reductase] hydrolase